MKIHQNHHDSHKIKRQEERRMRGNPRRKTFKKKEKSQERYAQIVRSLDPERVA
jgi:hypothetical protein